MMSNQQKLFLNYMTNLASPKATFLRYNSLTLDVRCRCFCMAKTKIAWQIKNLHSKFNLNIPILRIKFKKKLKYYKKKIRCLYAV